MAMSIGVVGRQAMVDALVDLLNSATAQIELRSGARAAPDATATGTILATIDCAVPAFGAASSADPAVATAGGVPLSAVASAGSPTDATHFRALNSVGTCIWTGSVGVSGSGADLILNNVSITSGGTVTATSWTVSLPEAQT